MADNGLAEQAATPEPYEGVVRNVAVTDGVCVFNLHGRCMEGEDPPWAPDPSRDDVTYWHTACPIATMVVCTALTAGIPTSVCGVLDDYGQHRLESITLEVGSPHRDGA